MARHTDPDYLKTEAPTRRFISAALRAQDSILTPGKALWTPSLLGEFRRHVVDRPVLGPGTFLSKLKEELTGASPDLIQLTAEILYAHLITPWILGANKRTQVQEVLNWASPSIEVDHRALEDLDGRLVQDRVLNMRHMESMAYLARFAENWWEQDDAARARILSDPWSFKAFAHSIELPWCQSQREMLMYLVHPDTFERISSINYKEQIAQFFGETNADEDVDRRLLRLRQTLTPKYGAGFNYWTEPVRSTWLKPGSTVASNKWEDLLYLSGWDALIGWISLAFESKDFEARERDYKLEIAERLRDARKAVRAGRDDWTKLVKKALRKDNNLIDFRVGGDLIGWFDLYPAEGLAALQEVWRDGVGFRDRAQRFLSLVPRDILRDRGRALQVVSVLLMVDGVAHPPVKVRVFKQAFELVGYPPAPSDAVAMYEHALAFLDQVLARGRKAGAELRDRLDAQSALWMILHWSEKPAEWSNEQWEALIAFREGEGPDDAGLPLPPSPEDDAPAPKSLQSAADELLLPLAFLEDVRTLLEEKRQVIFYGPPGTGKTYVAMELAKALTADEDDVLLVQFHPSYAYEDFVEGYRPRKVDGQAGFELVQGPLKQIAEKARKDEKGRCILLIDEINRGNLARVFGELFFLLEYRGRSAALQYSPDQEFSLPKNLWIIGTMNTADRSIALIDAALRRRFAFVPFFPNQYPLKGLLGRWFEEKRGPADLAWIADVVDLVNERLEAMPEIGRHLQIGPSHFMSRELTSAAIDRIWKYSILPFLEEQFFGREAALDDFELAKLHTQADQRRRDQS